jgi:hypothetical protein
MTTTIATLAEFAYAIRKTEAQAARHQLLLELAEGLVIENLGVLDTYPVSAKAVALEAAARAYFALRAAEQEGRPDRPRPAVLVPRHLALPGPGRAGRRPDQLAMSERWGS